MSDLQIPYEFIQIIDGKEWYMLAKTIGWLKGIDGSVQINPYKRRCSKANMIKFKMEDEKGKDRVYVNRDGLIEIVERTPSVSLDYKRLLGVASGITRSEHVFSSLLMGFFGEIGVNVDSQVKHGDYRIDFVLGGVLAIEYDESKHDSYDKKREAVREAEIKRKYSLIRISDDENEGSAIAKIYSEYCKII